MTGSYMKVTLSQETGSSMDEKILLKNKLPGMLETRSCSISGRRQWWFSISGKQSLDTVCDVKPVGTAMLEKLIISLCRQIELLEKHLVDTDCLCLDKEMVYSSNADGDFLFAAVPCDRRPLQEQLRELMEFILTKLDHQDTRAVQVAYQLYEKMLEDGFGIEDLRQAVIEGRQIQEEKIQEKREELPPPEPVEKAKEEPVLEEKNYFLVPAARQKKEGWMKKFLKWLDHLIGEGEEDEFLFEPMIYEGPRETQALNPTVCLAASPAGVRGMLLYEGSGSIPDITLRDPETIIGKASDCRGFLADETVSLHHAKITKSGEDYMLEDLNSTNGTYVNGRVLPYKEKHALKTGDLIRIADLRFRFV